jgi:hypothetical protein
MPPPPNFGTLQWYNVKTKFQPNLSSGSRVKSCGQTDRHDQTIRCSLLTLGREEHLKMQFILPYSRDLLNLIGLSFRNDFYKQFSVCVCVFVCI